MDTEGGTECRLFVATEHDSMHSETCPRLDRIKGLLREVVVDPNHWPEGLWVAGCCDKWGSTRDVTMSAWRYGRGE